MTTTTEPRIAEPRERTLAEVAAIRARHREKKTWPLFKGQADTAPDGYRHWCSKCHDPWPCDVIRVLALLTPSTPEGAPE